MSGFIFGVFLNHIFDTQRFIGKTKNRYYQHIFKPVHEGDAGFFCVTGISVKLLFYCVKVFLAKPLNPGDISLSCASFEMTGGGLVGWGSGARRKRKRIKRKDEIEKLEGWKGERATGSLDEV